MAKSSSHQPEIARRRLATSLGGAKCFAGRKSQWQRLNGRIKSVLSVGDDVVVHVSMRQLHYTWIHAICVFRCAWISVCMCMWTCMCAPIYIYIDIPYNANEQIKTSYNGPNACYTWWNHASVNLKLDWVASVGDYTIVIIVLHIFKCIFRVCPGGVELFGSSSNCGSCFAACNVGPPSYKLV